MARIPHAAADARGMFYGITRTGRPFVHMQSESLIIQAVSYGDSIHVGTCWVPDGQWHHETQHCTLTEFIHRFPVLDDATVDA